MEERVFQGGRSLFQGEGNGPFHIEVEHVVERVLLIQYKQVPEYLQLHKLLQDLLIFELQSLRKHLNYPQPCKAKLLDCCLVLSFLSLLGSCCAQEKFQQLWDVESEGVQKLFKIKIKLLLPLNKSKILLWNFWFIRQLIKLLVVFLILIDYKLKHLVDNIGTGTSKTRVLSLEFCHQLCYEIA